jgi:hypothetical protein
MAEEVARFATKCGFKNLHIADSGMLSLYTCGRTTGMVVEPILTAGGHVDVYTTAIYEGYLVRQTAVRLQLAGLFGAWLATQQKSLDAQLAELFSAERGELAVHMVVWVGRLIHMNRKSVHLIVSLVIGCSEGTAT